MCLPKEKNMDSSRSWSPALFPICRVRWESSSVSCQVDLMEWSISWLARSVLHNFPGLFERRLIHRIPQSFALSRDLFGVCVSIRFARSTCYRCKIMKTHFGFASAKFQVTFFFVGNYSGHWHCIVSEAGWASGCAFRTNPKQTSEKSEASERLLEFFD